MKEHQGEYQRHATPDIGGLDSVDSVVGSNLSDEKMVSGGSGNRLAEEDRLRSLREELQQPDSEVEEDAAPKEDASKIPEIKELFQDSLNQILAEAPSKDKAIEKKRNYNRNYLMQATNWLSWFDDVLQNTQDQEKIILSARDKVAFDDIKATIQSFYDRDSTEWASEDIDDEKREYLEQLASKYQEILAWTRKIDEKVEAVVEREPLNNRTGKNKNQILAEEVQSKYAEWPKRSFAPSVEAVQTQMDEIAEKNKPPVVEKTETQEVVPKADPEVAENHHSVLARQTAEKYAKKLGKLSFKPSQAAVQKQVDAVAEKDKKTVETTEVATEEPAKVERKPLNNKTGKNKDQILAEEVQAKYAKRSPWSFSPSKESVQKRVDVIAQKENARKAEEQKIEAEEIKSKEGFLSRYFSFNKKNASKFSGQEQLAKAEKTNTLMGRLFWFLKDKNKHEDLESLRQYKEQSDQDIEDSITQVIFDTINAYPDAPTFQIRSKKIESDLETLFKRQSIGSKTGKDMQQYIVDNLAGALESRESIPPRNRNLKMEEFIKDYIDRKKKSFNLN